MCVLMPLTAPGSEWREFNQTEQKPVAASSRSRIRMCKLSTRTMQSYSPKETCAGVQVLRREFVVVYESVFFSFFACFIHFNPAILRMVFIPGGAKFAFSLTKSIPSF